MANIFLRLSDELHKTIKESARQNHRSMNGELVRAIEYYLKNAPEAHYKALQVEEKQEEKAA